MSPSIFLNFTPPWSKEGSTAPDTEFPHTFSALSIAARCCACFFNILFMLAAVSVSGQHCTCFYITDFHDFHSFHMDTGSSNLCFWLQRAWGKLRLQFWFWPCSSRPGADQWSSDNHCCTLLTSDWSINNYWFHQYIVIQINNYWVNKYILSTSAGKN